MVISRYSKGGLNNKSGPGFKFVLISMYNFNHLGIRAIHSFLKSKGIKVELIFFKNMLFNDAKRPTPEEINMLIKLIKEKAPGLVGISVSCSAFFNIAKEITKNIKQEVSAPVIWGGVHPTIDPDQCIKHVDMVFVGEGEFGLLDLINCKSKNHDYSSIPGLWVKNSSGQIIKNRPSPLKNFLDLIPPNDYEDDLKYSIENGKLAYGDPYHKGNELYTVFTGRGCPFDCTYCINHVFKEIYTLRRNPIRRRTVAHVINELSIAKEIFSNLSRITIFDDVFVMDEKWAKEFCDQYKEKIGLPFSCLFHPSTIKNSVLSILKKGGLDYINMGLQSGSERIRRDIFGRIGSNQVIIKAMHAMQSHKIQPVIDLILDNPFETIRDKQQTLELLLNFPRPFWFNFYSLVYFPKTKLTQLALEHKYITRDDIEDKKEKIFDQFHVTFSYKRKKEELFWICLFSLTGKSFVPKYFIRELSRIQLLAAKPVLLVILATLSNYFRIIGIGLKRLFAGQLTFAVVKRYLKMALTLNR